MRASCLSFEQATRSARAKALNVDGVMLVHVEIAVRFYLKIERPVPRDELEHVVQKPDAGVHGVSALALDTQRDGDAGLFRPSLDYGAAHKTSSIAAMQRRVCSTIPVAMPTEPAQPGSFDRSRR